MSRLSYALLLEDVKGYKKYSAFVKGDKLEGELTHKIISKGSLLVQLSKNDVSKIQDTYKYPVNYMEYAIPSTECYLLVGDHEICPVSNQQRDLLYGIEGLIERLEVCKRLGWIEKLTEGSEVYVTIATVPHPIRGIVRWIGKLTGEHGKKFGIELMEKKSKGTSNGWCKGQQYFTCKSNCAVFVSVDKLTDLQTASAAIPKSEDEIKMGSLVIFFDSNNHAEKGTVRWIGSPKLPDNKKIIGIEAEKKITKKIPCRIKGMNDHFTATKSENSRIFLPITYVHKYPPPIKQGDDSSNVDSMPELLESENDENFDDAPEFQGAVKPPGSPSQFGSDKQDHFYDCHDNPNSPSLVKKTNVHDFEVGSEIIYNGNPGVIKWIGYPPGCEEKMAGLEMLKDYTLEEFEDGYWDGKFVYECTPLRGMFVNLPDLQLANGSKRKMLQGDSTNPSKRPNIDDHNRLLHVNTGLSSSPTSLPGSSMVLNQNPYNLKVGSAVKYDDPPKYGVVKWIGVISGHGKTLYAGVEMDEVFDGSTDGIWAGYKYVDLQPGRGKLVRLTELEPSERRPSKHPAISSINKQLQLDNKKSSASTSKQTHPTLETGSAVELGKPPDTQYGVIRWIRSIYGEVKAYVEMEDGSGQTFPVAVLRCDSRFDDNKVEEKPNDAKTETNDKPSKEAPIISQKFEVGSLIQFGDPTQYGVIKQLQDELAEVELENFDCRMIPLAEIELDSRFLVDVNKKQAKNPLESMLYEHEGDIFVPPDETFDEKKHTRTKGIQGYKNSCYLDATMYGMFAFSTAFDVAFLDEVTTDNEVFYTQRMLKNKIVYPLRFQGIVVQDSIEVFRTHLAVLQDMKGLTSEEKDPEEFINVLFKHIIHLEPFVTIRRPSGTDKEFLIQLFVESNANVATVTTQELLNKMFKDNNITFAKYPTRLLLQVPRSGKQFKSFKRCIPSLQLDITDLCKTSGPCFVCNEPGGCMCDDCCNEEFLKYKMNLYFCANCWPLWHQKAHRQNHKHRVMPQKDDIDDDFDTGTLQLLSVLCIETSHYVCFTRITGSGKDEWVFFDSMAERQDNGYNIPKVTHCTDILEEYVYGENKQDISQILSKELPELVRRYVEDAYLCIYVDHDGVMYQ